MDTLQTEAKQNGRPRILKPVDIGSLHQRTLRLLEAVLFTYEQEMIKTQKADKLPPKPLVEGIAKISAAIKPYITEGRLLQDKADKEFGDLDPDEIRKRLASLPKVK